MSFTFVKVRVYSFDMSRHEDSELLVDSKALFTSISRSVLEKLGLKPIARYRLRTFGGEVVEYEGRRAVVPIIFGESGNAQVLGVTALEALGYQLDPVTKRLKPVEFLNGLAIEPS